MLRQDLPILEFDPSTTAVINPSAMVTRVAFPKLAVACFFKEVVEDVVKAQNLTAIAVQKTEMGDLPIYALSQRGAQIAFFYPCIGAPLAAAMLEEVIAHGAQAVIACGGCGVLDSSIPLGQIVVPTSAIRDEGTSYHYLPPSREVFPSDRAVAAIGEVLHSEGITHRSGTTWTTDAVYRETPDKVKLRRAEGCLTVDMEAAALFAVAQFRGIDCAELFYAGDNVGGGSWEHRNWNVQPTTRKELFRLACEACSYLSEEWASR